MRQHLKFHIISVVEGIKHLSVDSAADLLAEIADDLAGDRDDDMINGAILDGIRWGYAAAAGVEMAGGAMLRVILPGGIQMTHEWESDAEAKPRIKVALATLRTDRVTASNVGDDE